MTDILPCEPGRCASVLRFPGNGPGVSTVFCQDAAGHHFKGGVHGKGTVHHAELHDQGVWCSVQWDDSSPAAFYRPVQSPVPFPAPVSPPSPSPQAPLACKCTPSGLEISCLSCKGAIESYLANVMENVREAVVRFNSVKAPKVECALCTRFWIDECFESAIVAFSGAMDGFPAPIRAHCVVSMFEIVGGMARSKGIPMSRSEAAVVRVVRSLQGGGS